MSWFWVFVFYSFVGFLLEVGYARLSRSRRDRKGLLLLPLCPVYGLGAMGILLAAPLGGKNPVFLFFIGAAVSTGVEYLVAWWYERALGVSFWDYSDVPGNFRGKVCLPFSLAWGVLSLGLVGWLHPMVRPWLARVPRPVTLAMMLLVGTDFLVSCVMMKRTGDRKCLQWYLKT